MNLLKAIMSLMVFFFVITNIYGDENNKKDLLHCPNITSEDIRLDKQYRQITQKMEQIINRYKIHEKKDIQIVPYQVEYTQGKDFIKIEKHAFKKSPYDMTRILSVHKKSLTIYIKEKKVSKLIVEIYKKNYESSRTTKLTLIDKSPTSGLTGDISITQEVNGIRTFNNKKLKDFRNTTANPLRNELKRYFLISHVEQFKSYIVYIGERYDNSKKNNEKNATNFLRRESLY